MKATKDRNKLSHWTLVHRAMDAVSGYTARLGMASRSVNSGNFKIGQRGQEIALTARVDDWVREHVHLMKIDVEGHEARVIMGAMNLICQYGVEAIVMEFTHDLRTSAGCRWMDLFTWLHRIGYVLKNPLENIIYRQWRGHGWKPKGANVVFVLNSQLSKTHARCAK